jgi:glycerol-3-phosphate dehydrogenase
MGSPSFRRDLGPLASTHFDALVVGGGILGACIAWDAALRGLSVALVDRRDFGSGTSSNSLKIVHGGLRYLQSLNFRRMRESIRERSTWLRNAPHLVEPLPVLIPTYRNSGVSRRLLWAAARVNDLLSWDRNRGLMPERRLPAGRALSRRQCLDLVPEIDTSELTGGVLFYDGQIYSSERLVLEVVQAAHRAGAAVASYVEVEGPIPDGSSGFGATVRDARSGGRFEIRTHVVVNAAGPNAPGLLRLFLSRKTPTRPSAFSLAMNLMFPASGHSVAFAIRKRSTKSSASGARGGRYLFAAPWRQQLIVGTAHYPYEGDPAAFRIEQAPTGRFLDEILSSWPSCPFTERDVRLVHAGLLPARVGDGGPEVRLLERHGVVGHARDGVPGMISAVSAKFTTGRLAAEEVVDRIFRYLGRRSPPCRTHATRLPGADFASLTGLRSRAEQKYGSLVPPDVLGHLVRSYGSEYERVLEQGESAPQWSERLAPGLPVTAAQFWFGAREEMAVCAEDLLDRRTELGARGIRSGSLKAAATAALEGRVTLRA